MDRRAGEKGDKGRGTVRRLLVINQYYAPDVASTGQYAADICSGLTSYGFEVHVVTGEPSYSINSPDAPDFEILNGVNVYRVPLGNVKGREDNKTRFKGYVRFLRGAWRLARKLLRLRKFDIILTFHNPPFVGLLGALLAKKYKIRFVYIPYDIHPDVLVATGWRIPKLFVWVWGVVNRMVFKVAEKVVVLSEGMKNTLVHGKKVPAEKIEIIPLWGKPELDATSSDNLIREELKVKDSELLLLYAGNMGILHPLDIIIEAAKRLQGKSVKFLFIGDGAKRRYLMERVKNENIKQVSFLPFQPVGKFIQILVSSDACLVTIGKGLENLALPSRIFTFMSAGKPIITIMNPEADVAKIIRENNCGWNVQTSDELAELILDLLKDPIELKQKGKQARKTYLNQFRRDKLIKQYAQLLK
ncbi:MAG: hypothetical protein DRN91_04525 [Candidatus Alkanophagales archaeon]|nr:MAG: hypothetical protein DRN91_04525 [Candidatus Alkanophagales archaeon]